MCFFLGGGRGVTKHNAAPRMLGCKKGTLISESIHVYPRFIPDMAQILGCEVEH